MRRKKMLLSAIFALALTSCINDADVIGPNQPVEPTTPTSEGNIAFKFVIPNNSDSRSAETSGNLDEGSKEEYNLNNVYVYLFNDETGNIVKTINIGSADLQAPTVNGTTVSYAQNNKYAITPGKYRILAVANAQKDFMPGSVADLLSKIDEETYTEGLVPEVPDGGIMMTNRGFHGTDGSPLVELIEGAPTTEVTITLERVLAKVLLSRTKGSYELEDGNGETFATVTPSAYAVVNLNKKFYLYRHVATLANTDKTPSPITNWSIDDNFGNIPDVNGYCIDPNFFKKKVDVEADFDGSSMFAGPLTDITASAFSGTFAAPGSPISFYCLENCMFRPAQKNAYTSGVVIKCNLTIPANRCFDDEGNYVEEKNQPKTLYYANYNFYTTIDALKKFAKVNVPDNEDDYAKYGIKVFTKDSNASRNCYYNYWIKHLNNNDETIMGVMEFGIVRNNIYDINITNILSLGPGDPTIVPDDPDENKAELSISFVVRPWIVRDQDAELE